MATAQPTAKNMRELAKPGEIKAYVHPTRLVILRSVADEAHTISQVAASLRVHPANLTHHFRKLQKAGLIRLVEKRNIGRTVEKYYQATARRFTVGTKGASLRGKQALALAIVRDDLTTAMQQVGAGTDEPVLALLSAARVRPRDIGRFLKRLRVLAEEFSKADVPAGTAYHLNLSLYPAETASVPDERVILD